MNDIILVSGGFDPIHSGHIYLIANASKYGDVVVLLNSDAWLIQKKGKEFLPYKEREMIMNALKSVIDVIAFDDSDKTCIDGIRKAIEKYPNRKIKFANGGDRNDNTSPLPEKVYCEQNKVKVLWGIGGDNKANSSSWILKKWCQK
tara:strand:- start:93 stop:530 length:438 start_codon:yes stop_codon:yes gene_type:complete